MRTYDFSPLYRSTIGFDRLFDLVDQASRVEPLSNWPPYDIERLDENSYRITVAVAGFASEEIDLTQNTNVLTVVGQKKPAETAGEYLHRGIAQRGFKQTFNLADHVRVTGADLKDGLLSIALLREVPEALKPRTIAINGTVASSEPARLADRKAA